MRILVIEDDKDIREFLKLSLEGESFSVDVAEDGSAGSMLARINDYDVVILDNFLPKKNAEQVCREIREKKRPVRILVLSVESEASQKVVLLNCGADDYLTKPFSFEELVARVRALMRRPAIIHFEVLTVDNLTLNTINQTVTRNEKEIHLTRKEFELLEYLMRNQGRVLSRGLILEHVWDVSADPFSNTLETHILNLRRKIDKGANQRVIQTVSGRGYKIDTKYISA